MFIFLLLFLIELLSIETLGHLKQIQRSLYHGTDLLQFQNKFGQNDLAEPVK